MSVPSLKMPVEYKIDKTSKKIIMLGLRGINKIPHFSGTALIESMFFLYLFKKYKAPCYLIEDYKSGYEILGVTLPIENEYTEDSLRPIITYLKSVASKLVKCILNGANIIMIPLELRIYQDTKDSMGHANMLIYRKKYNHIEHFEPHGQKFIAGSIENQVLIQQSINLLLKIFVESINEELFTHSHKSAKDINPLQLITSNDVCPYLHGFQAEEEFIDLFKDVEKEGGGYCSAWSMFFTELCLKNPNLTSNEIITRVFNLYNRSKIGEFLRNVIRGYALFIDEKINKYFAFLNEGEPLNIEKIIKMSTGDKNILYGKMKFIINMEMEMAYNPNSLDEKIKTLKKEIQIYERYGRFPQTVDYHDDDDDDVKALYKRLEYDTLLTYKRNIDHFDSVNSESDIQIVSNKPEILIEKGCPPGKEINPVTKRCIKIKVKTPRQEKKILINELIHLPKECPPGKEWNPDTRRCRNIIVKKTKRVKSLPPPRPLTPPPPIILEIKQCPPGKEWNPDTKRCRKITVKKTKKVKETVEIQHHPINLPSKSCPPGKEINPKTNRCIKIKTMKTKS
jgi:hypothetical protein